MTLRCYVTQFGARSPVSTRSIRHRVCAHLPDSSGRIIPTVGRPIRLNGGRNTSTQSSTCCTPDPRGGTCHTPSLSAGPRRAQAPPAAMSRRHLGQGSQPDTRRGPAPAQVGEDGPGQQRWTHPRPKRRRRPDRTVSTAPRMAVAAKSSYYSNQSTVVSCSHPLARRDLSTRSSRRAGPAAPPAPPVAQRAPRH